MGGISALWGNLPSKPTTKQRTAQKKGGWGWGGGDILKGIILIHKAPFHHTRTLLFRIIRHVAAGCKQEIRDDFLTGFSC